RSKLIARATPGFRVRSERPIAESASALIMPPWTKPAWLAMSSAGVISTVALPSPSSTRLIPSQRHAGDTTSTWLLTTLALRHRDHAPAAAVLRSGDQLQDDPAGLGLGDPCAQGLHPPGRRRLQQRSSPGWIRVLAIHGGRAPAGHGGRGARVLNMFVFS